MEELHYKIKNNLLYWDIQENSVTYQPEYVEFKSCIGQGAYLPYAKRYIVLPLSNPELTVESYINYKNDENCMVPLHYYRLGKEQKYCSGYYLKDIYIYIPENIVYDANYKKAYPNEPFKDYNAVFQTKEIYKDNTLHLSEIYGILTIYYDKTNDIYKLLEYYGNNTWREIRLIKINPIEYKDNFLSLFPFGIPLQENSYVWNQDDLKQAYKDLYGEEIDIEDNKTITYKGYNDNTVTIQDSMYSVDVDEMGNLLDYRKSYKEPYYLKCSPYNNEKLTLCGNFYLYDIFNLDETKLYGGTYNYSKNTFILVEIYKNQYQEYEYSPLYSPELLNEFGIGFICSDWLSYDSKGNLIIEWWPERCDSLFYKEERHEHEEEFHYQNNYEDSNISKEKLTKYSQANPFIGTVYRWRTALYESDKTFYYYDNNWSKNIDYHEYTGDYNLAGTPHIYLGEYFKSDIGETTDIRFPRYRHVILDNDENNKINSYRTIISLDNIKSKLNENFNTKIDVNPQENLYYFNFLNIFYNDDYNGYAQNIGERVQNIAIFDDYENNTALYLLGNYKDFYGNKYNKYNYVKWIKEDNTRSNEYDHIDEPVVYNYNTRILLKDTDNNTIFKYNRWTKYLVKSVDIYNPTKNYQKMFDYTFDSYVPTKTIIESQTDNNPEELLENIEKNDEWKTPSEYYSEKPTSSYTGYTKTETTMNTGESKNWFWVDELKNWCIWKRIDHYFVELYVWNGKNGWDNLDTIITAWQDNDWQTLINTYFYNKKNFIIGPTYNEFEGFQCNNNKAVLWYKSLVINEKFSTYDQNSFQNIRNSELILANDRYVTQPDIDVADSSKVANVFSTVGCPCIVRSNGQLYLLYKFKYEGNFTSITMSDERNALKDDIENINNICVMYFGNGNDKTIKNWKRFTKVNDYEEKFTQIVDENNETIYGKPPQVNSIAESINMNIELTVPRPNVTSKGTYNEDYVLRWDR